jgi:class 3 adenylate cyclase
MMRSDFTRAEFGQRVAQGLEVMRLAQQSRGANAAASVLAAHHSLLAVALEFGDRALHDEHLAGTTRLAAEIRSPGQTAIALLIRARTAIMEGRFDDADRFIDEYLAYAQRAGVAQQVATAAVVAFPLQRERGALAAAELATRRATERFPTVTAYRAGLVLLLAELGRLDEARGQVATLAADDFAGIADDGARVFTLALIAEVVARLGEPAWAARLYELLRPSEGLGVLLLAQGSFWGATDRFLGVLAGALGHHDQALAHLDAANDMHERMLARPWVARTQYDRACVLAARGAPGDPAAAVALANRALATANELGMTRLVEETLALKLALQGVELSSVSASIDAVTAAVSLQRPDLRPHAAADGWVTIAFSDVEGYTSLTERLGDTRTQHILRAHHEIVRATLADHHGTEVKSQGDGFMLAFTHTADALGWAIAVQRAIATHDFGSDAGTLRVRIGIHAGEVVREADDFYGRTVIIASRVAAAAHGGQTLVTGAVRSAVGPDRFGFDAGRDLALKGLGGTTRAYAVQPHSDT